MNVLRGPAFPVVSSPCGRLGPLSRAELTSWLTSPLNEAQFSMDHHGWARTGHTQAPGSPRGDKAGWLAHLSPRKVAPRAITLFHKLPQNWNRAAPRGAVVSLSSHLHRPLALMPSSTPQAAQNFTPEQIISPPTGLRAQARLLVLRGSGVSNEQDCSRTFARPDPGPPPHKSPRPAQQRPARPSGRVMNTRAVGLQQMGPALQQLETLNS